VSSSNTERAQGEVLVEMPQMGVSVAEGTLAVWHKQVGDWVEADEIICEISTDKIDTDLPSPAAGRVVELLVAENETVPVGAPLARIATGAAPGEAHPAEQDDASAVRSPEGNGAPVARPAIYSPVVQRIASEHGIDLSTVRGTGRAGRIRKQDVLAAAAARAGGQDAAVPAEAAQQAEPDAQPRGAPLETSGAAPPPAPRGEPLSRMRRAIAEHMTRSLRTAAHCTTIIEADFSRVERERARIGSSPLPIVARAVIDALRRHPALNATLEGEILTRHRDVNLGIAVSLGERGLIVPVIHRAQELSAEGLSARIAELARRAREDELTPDEVRGGTFTITNPGGFGSIASTPIINQPQVAILDLEAVVKRPVALTDDSGADVIAVRPMAYLCLSWDHRALDGALAAHFLATLRGLLEGQDVDR
jgi:pyruvate/2-oxoglutarate dehydrogenase complex dihydrolipoamide acyltransferase (E2) component